jgi:hypothetical protein
MDWLCRNKGHNLPYPTVQHSTLLLCDPWSPLTGGNSTNLQQLSHRCKLNLVMNPHKARCLDLTGRLSETTTRHPVPVQCHCHHSLHPEDGGDMVLRNVDILPHHYVLSQPRKPGSESSPWKRQISLYICFVLHRCYNCFVRGCIQKFPGWPRGARTTNVTALCH